jgi:hypothetical protein
MNAIMNAKTGLIKTPKDRVIAKNIDPKNKSFHMLTIPIFIITKSMMVDVAMAVIIQTKLSHPLTSGLGPRTVSG